MFSPDGLNKQQNCTIFIVLRILLEILFRVRNLLHDLRFSIGTFCCQLRNCHLSHRFNQQFIAKLQTLFCKELVDFNHRGLNVSLRRFHFVLSLLQIYSARQLLWWISQIWGRAINRVCLHDQKWNKHIRRL